MSNLILTIVNQALSKVGETTITAAEFNSGNLTTHCVCRERTQDIVYKLFKIKHDLLMKSLFSFSTISGQADYDLGFNPSRLDGTDLYVINDSSYKLQYLALDEALASYTDFNLLTVEGQPYEYWFHLTTIPGIIKLRINPIPDNIYTIQGMKYAEFERVQAEDMTMCDVQGDRVIQMYLAAKLANEFQKGNTADLISEFNSAYHNYLAQNSNINNLNISVIPAQHAHSYDSLW